MKPSSRCGRELTLPASPAATQAVEPELSGSPQNGENMTRKNPKARRATALAILTSLFLAVNAGAFLFPHPASADVTVSTTGRRPMPGDPNTPDEGGRSSTQSTTLQTSELKSP